MTVANINFTKTYTPPPSNAVNLRIGTPDAPDVDPLTAVLLMSKPAPRMYVDASYESRVSRPVTAEPDLLWQGAEGNDVPVGGGWQSTDPMRVQVVKPWQQARPLHTAAADYAQQMDRMSVALGVPWQQGVPVFSRNIAELYNVLSKEDQLKALPWQQARPLSALATGLFEQLLPAHRLVELRWQDARLLQALLRERYSRALPLPRHVRVPWDITRQPPSGREAPVVVPPVNPPYKPSTDLNFMCRCTFPSPPNIRLNFGKHPCPGDVAVETKEVYIIVNELSMKRVDDNTPIELVSASVGIDKSSWCWSFSGAVPYYEFEKIEPGATGPVEVELNINGLLWRLLIEKYNTKELFAKTDVSISGRSVTAWLDDPYAPVRSYSQDATIGSRALAEAELTRAGLVTGFELDWQLIDSLGWLMPANSWSYTDLTPMQVIKAIAEGVGGYVNSHPYEKKVLVRSEYPVPFWEWDAATLNHTIPDALVLARSLDWEERPIYNGVYVSGENTGVNDFIRRMGTNGGMQAQMYINPMITDHAASRHKGIQILSASGKQARVGLDLPMEPALGLITPGMLIRVQKDAATGWRGLVSSTQINADWGDSLTVVQSIELERHYGGL